MNPPANAIAAETSSETMNAITGFSENPPPPWGTSPPVCERVTPAESDCCTKMNASSAPRIPPP